jgi:hypothetical protein
VGLLIGGTVAPESGAPACLHYPHLPSYSVTLREGSEDDEVGYIEGSST